MAQIEPRLCRACGKSFTPRPSQIYSGTGFSCSRSCSARSLKRRTLHGHTPLHGKASPTYNTWTNMKARCQRPTSTKFSDYGAKGITVCERWQNFANFLADMGERPEGTTLDRIDPAGNYEPGNCRWATPMEQSSHIRRKRSIIYRGKEYRLSDLSRELGIDPRTLVYRVENGWSDDALARPGRWVSAVAIE